MHLVSFSAAIFHIYGKCFGHFISITLSTEECMEKTICIFQPWDRIIGKWRNNLTHQDGWRTRKELSWALNLSLTKWTNYKVVSGLILATIWGSWDPLPTWYYHASSVVSSHVRVFAPSLEWRIVIQLPFSALYANAKGQQMQKQLLVLFQNHEQHCLVIAHLVTWQKMWKVMSWGVSLTHWKHTTVSIIYKCISTLKLQRWIRPFYPSPFQFVSAFSCLWFVSTGIEQDKGY